MVKFGVVVDQVGHDCHIDSHRILLSALFEAPILVERQIDRLGKDHVVGVINKGASRPC